MGCLLSCVESRSPAAHLSCLCYQLQEGVLWRLTLLLQLPRAPLLTQPLLTGSPELLLLQLAGWVVPSTAELANISARLMMRLLFLLLPVLLSQSLPLLLPT